MKVKGEINLADALTKALDGSATNKHIRLTGQEVKTGRHVLTPEFETAETVETQEDIEEDGNCELDECVSRDLAQNMGLGGDLRTR